MYGSIIDVLSKQQEQPKIPQILKYRQKINNIQNTIIFPSEKNPKEIIINVDQLNKSQNITPRTSYPGIRGHIDDCLEVIETTLHEESMLYGNSSSLKVNSIHRVDRKLIMEYSNTINEQYQLNKRFQTNRKETSIQEESPRTNPSRRRNNRRFLSVTTSSKQNNTNKSNLRAEQERIELMNIKKVVTQTKEDREQPSFVKKYTDDFRYCLSCEKPVLSLNIHFHEKYECRDLEKIYNMDMNSLKKLLLDKIQRIEDSIGVRLNKIEYMFSENKAISTNNEIIANEMIEKIKTYLSKLKNQSHNFKESSLYYNSIKQTLTSNLFDLIDETHKLNWFVQVYNSLEEVDEVARSNRYSEGELVDFYTQRSGQKGFLSTGIKNSPYDDQTRRSENINMFKLAESYKIEE